MRNGHPGKGDDLTDDVRAGEPLSPDYTPTPQGFR